VAASLPAHVRAGLAAGPGRPERSSFSRRALSEPASVRLALIATAIGFLGLFVLLPLGTVFWQAFALGVGPYFAALAQAETLAAIRLTLLVAAIVVPANVIFGVAASWLVAKYRFPGKNVLLALIDLPFSVSPVISGLIFVLLFGGRSTLGRWLAEAGIPVIFAVPGIVLATTFVTFPFVMREVLPVMQASGNDEEEAALTLGAGGWWIFFRVTLPKIKWGVLYGIILCNARAMGEFGAVSVVSGHIRGRTNTMPLQVEILYNEYDFVGAFAVASLLSLLAVATLIVKRLVEAREAARA
jgi:sulfate/thiosulfate transport system permease protein